MCAAKALKEPRLAHQELEAAHLGKYLELCGRNHLDELVDARARKRRTSLSLFRASERASERAEKRNTQRERETILHLDRTK